MNLVELSRIQASLLYRVTNVPLSCTFCFSIIKMETKAVKI